MALSYIELTLYHYPPLSLSFSFLILERIAPSLRLNITINSLMSFFLLHKLMSCSSSLSHYGLYALGYCFRFSLNV